MTDSPNQPVPSRAHTKIVATIGPASEDHVEDLIRAGMSVARINFSHQTADDHRRRIAKVRAVSERLHAPVAILADIRGPKMRLGTFPGGSRELEVGERHRVIEGPGPAGENELPFDFGGFAKAVRPGHRALLADGGVEMVFDHDPDDPEGELCAVVRRAGTVGDKKGVHLPDTELEMVVPTPQDEEDLALCRELSVELVGVSFVARASELARVRELVPEALLVAKVERKVALQNLEEIIQASDGVMVARGDLGVEMPPEELPMIQKNVIHEAVRMGRFAITATEMLESMVTSSRPTRAEVTDVANAVFDGTDALMLSAETAVGEHPVSAVETMCRIARAVEASPRYREMPRTGFRSSEPDFSNATGLAAVDAAEALGLDRIVCFTETGNTPRQLTRYRPTAEVVAFTPNHRTLNQLAILAHVRPMPFPQVIHLEQMLACACEALVERGLAHEGDRLVFVAGVPLGQTRSTNLMKLHRIGESLEWSGE